MKNDILVLSNLTANWGRPLLVGAGDHGRALAAYMTGVQVYRTAGADLKLGVSADQIAANAIGHLTKLPSLEIGLEEARQAGNCDNGYSCAYAYNLSWKTETQPLPPISDPRQLFERLFGADIVESPAAHATPPRHARTAFSTWCWRGHEEARIEPRRQPTAASSTSTSPRSAKSNSRWSAPKRTAW